MLTKEQIKKLKPGDPVVISTTFICVDTDGDIRFKAPSLNGGSFVHFISPKHVSLYSASDRTFCHVVDPMVKPKHNTCRSFKKGDKVRVDADLNEEVLTVAANQLNSSVTAMANDGQVIVMPCYFLKLITPVEEIRPYSVLETDTINGFDIMRDGLCVMTFPYGSKEAGYYRDKLAAKATAEAECKRLNEEHGKNQNNV